MSDEPQMIDWAFVPRQLTEAMRDAFWRNMTRDIEDGIASAADRCWADLLAAIPATRRPKIDWIGIYAAADAMRDKFRTLNASWFVDDQKNDGPRDCTPWNILAEVAIENYIRFAGPQTTEQTLREALRNLLDADRVFLGADNVCVYCGRHQCDEGHSPECVITKAGEALS